MSTLMDIVMGCENYLGFTPTGRPGEQLFKLRGVEVFKLRKAMAKHPSHIATIANLALALEYSRRKRLPVNSPITLLYRIPDALRLANTDTVTDLEVAIGKAIGWERDQDDEHSLNWIYRLKRAVGPGRDEVLTEWKAADRG